MKVMGGKDVVSLDEAKKLKTNGFSEPTEYYWLDIDLPYCPKGLYRSKEKYGGKMNHNTYDHIYSAPFVEDLL